MKIKIEKQNITRLSDLKPGDLFELIYNINKGSKYIFCLLNSSSLARVGNSTYAYFDMGNYSTFGSIENFEVVKVGRIVFTP